MMFAIVPTYQQEARNTSMVIVDRYWLRNLFEKFLEKNQY